MEIKAAIIGPGRQHNGTGEYVAKYLRSLGVEVTDIAATSAASAKAHAIALRDKYGIEAAAHANTEELFKNGSFNAVAICTPTEAHEKDILLALKHNKHVFSEKPLIWGKNMAPRAAEIVKNFYSSSLVLHYNVQWTYALKYYDRLYGKIAPKDVLSLEVNLSPSKPDAKFMIKEAAPHANSIALALGLKGADSLKISGKNNGMEISFKTKNQGGRDTDVRYVFKCKETQPRPASFTINNNTVRREVDMHGYKTFFCSDTERIEIPDLLLDSVSDFIKKVRDAKNGKVEEETAITENMRLLEKIYEAYCAKA
ncbi:MAG: Gfo/Idh/MocA family oxidoreductase [Deltaproteobacteria bacterium]|nr:Gfo/Idh/MocA family oxidoreductase [Deltaproteobacteria bacterium]